MFTGLKNNATVAKARLNLVQLKTEKQAAMEKLETVVLSNLSELMSAYYDYKQMGIAEVAATRNFEIVNNQYLLGQKSILDVLDAQQQNLTSAMSVNTAFYTFIKSYYDLQQSLGRFDYLMTPGEQADFRRRMDEIMNRN